MAVRPVTVNLRDPLYERLKRRAEQTQRTVEAELLEVVATAVPASEELPAYLAEAIAPLAQFDDAALWEMARTHFPVKAVERLDALHLQKQAEGISPAEVEELAALLREYERAMLVRDEAAAILKQRGHDVSGLLTSHSKAA